MSATWQPGMERQCKDCGRWHVLFLEPAKPWMQAGVELCFLWFQCRHRPGPGNFFGGHTDWAVDDRVRWPPGSCLRCHGLRFTCEQHPGMQWPHDRCGGPGVPCLVCNDGERPEMPPDFHSLIDGEE